MRDVGLELQGRARSRQDPLANLAKLGSFRRPAAGGPVRRLRRSTCARASSTPTRPRLGKLVAHFGAEVERLLPHLSASTSWIGEYQQGRIADAAIELYVSASVLNRLDQLLTSHAKPADELASELATGRYYLATAERRIRRNLDELWSNDDAETTPHGRSGPAPITNGEVRPPAEYAPHQSPGGKRRCCFLTESRRLPSSRRAFAARLGFVGRRTVGRTATAATSSPSFSRQSATFRPWSR